MKRVFVALAASAVLASCGAAATAQVTAPDPAAYRAAEITAQSNSERLAKLEAELDSAKRDMESLKVQNRQLADSYDSLVELVKEHKSLTISLIQQMKSILPPAKEAPAAEPKKN